MASLHIGAWTPEGLAKAAAVQLFDYQAQAWQRGMAQPGPQQRLCLYYKTGAGKSLTGLGLMALWGYRDVLVVAPPATHQQWEELGKKLNLQVHAVSHAKFRQPTFKISRTTAVIADEFHLFGGHGGKGWTKLDRLARGLEAPLVLMSATPNYNDAERVYCIQHILDPNSCKGGYLEFLYKHCTTEQNRFATMPIVTGFKNFTDAAEYLASLEKVEYVKDDLQYSIQEVFDSWLPPKTFTQYGLDERRSRIMASQIEERHAMVHHWLLEGSGQLRDHIGREIFRCYVDNNPGKSVMVFAVHKRVAEAIAHHLNTKYRERVGLVLGTDSLDVKNHIIEEFRQGLIKWLVGTATLATGTDGLDKVCDTLIIVDDTDDDALRRQLIGRIMPRGDATNLADKQVFRFNMNRLP